VVNATWIIKLNFEAKFREYMFKCSDTCCGATKVSGLQLKVNMLETGFNLENAPHSMRVSQILLVGLPIKSKNQRIAVYEYTALFEIHKKSII